MKTRIVICQQQRPSFFYFHQSHIGWLTVFYKASIRFQNLIFIGPPSMKSHSFEITKSLIHSATCSICSTQILFSSVAHSFVPTSQDIVHPPHFDFQINTHLTSIGCRGCWRFIDVASSSSVPLLRNRATTKDAQLRLQMMLHSYREECLRNRR